MNHKERIDAVLAFQPVDRTPFCLVDGGAWIAKTENLSYRQLYSLEDGGASKIVKWTDEVDTDIVSAVSGVFTACLNAFGCPIHIDEPGRPTEVKTLRDAGVDAFSCDYLVDLDTALTEAEGRMVIMGNINPAGVLLNGMPDKVYAEACERIRTANGRGIILAPGCDMGAATPAVNVKMLGKACKDSSVVN